MQFLLVAVVAPGIWNELPDICISVLSQMADSGIPDRRPLPDALPWQGEIITAALRGADGLCVMATGSGKSYVFQSLASQGRRYRCSAFRRPAEAAWLPLPDRAGSRRVTAAGSHRRPAATCCLVWIANRGGRGLLCCIRAYPVTFHNTGTPVLPGSACGCMASVAGGQGPRSGNRRGAPVPGLEALSASVCSTEAHARGNASPFRCRAWCLSVCHGRVDRFTNDCGPATPD